MPFYEYKCNSCQRHIEKFQRMNDAPLEFCPHCKAGGFLTKVPVAGSFKFKGGPPTPKFHEDRIIEYDENA